MQEGVNYATIYLRADNNKVEIKRHYQDFLEYYADKSMLIDLFNLLCIILGFYNSFMADISLRQKIFFFDKKKKEEPERVLYGFSIKKRETKTQAQNIPDDGKKGQLPNNIFPQINPEETKMQLPNNSCDQINTEEMIKQLSNNNENIVKKNKKRYVLSKCEKLKNFFCFCRKLKFKRNGLEIEDPNDIIDDKLDIVYYIKSMLLLETTNEIKYGDIKSYMNYLSSIPAVKSK